MPTTSYTPVHALDALSSPIRRRILEVLASGDHTSGQLAQVCGQEFRLSRTATSKQLRILRDAHLVRVQADENWRWYSLEPDGFDQALRFIDELEEKYRVRITLRGLELDGELVTRKGRGRPRGALRRGRQCTIPWYPDPEDEPPSPLFIGD